jgi:hypothetical protein
MVVILSDVTRPAGPSDKARHPTRRSPRPTALSIELAYHQSGSADWLMPLSCVRPLMRAKPPRQLPDAAATRPAPTLQPPCNRLAPAWKPPRCARRSNFLGHPSSGATNMFVSSLHAARTARSILEPVFQGSVIRTGHAGNTIREHATPATASSLRNSSTLSGFPGSSGPQYELAVAVCAQPALASGAFKSPPC